MVDPYEFFPNRYCAQRGKVSNLCDPPLAAKRSIELSMSGRAEIRLTGTKRENVFV